MKTILYFSAPWCVPCHQMKPAFTALMEEINQKYELIDVAENHAAATKYKVRGVPTIIVLEDGEITARATGSRTREQLLKLINGEE